MPQTKRPLRVQGSGQKKFRESHGIMQMYYFIFMSVKNGYNLVFMKFNLCEKPKVKFRQNCVLYSSVLEEFGQKILQFWLQYPALTFI